MRRHLPSPAGVRRAPLLIHVGTHELLFDDSLRLAERARAAGVDVTLEVWDGLFHVFHGVDSLPEARRALVGIADFARRRLEAPLRS